jgi:hypothetical protein
VLPLRNQTKRAKNSRFGPILGAWVVLMKKNFVLNKKER